MNGEFEIVRRVPVEDTDLTEILVSTADGETLTLVIPRSLVGTPSEDGCIGAMLKRRAETKSYIESIGE